MAYRAESEEQQAAWREHLIDQGLSVSPVMERNYFKSIYFRSPDVLLVGIATDPPGFAIDEEAGSLGQSLKLPAWLEPKRDEIALSLRPLE